jgi:hypothetical protein
MTVAIVNLFNLNCRSQEQESYNPGFRHHFRGGIGFSTSGTLSNVANFFQLVRGADLDTNPVVSGTYLYKLQRFVAIGGTVAYQHFSLSYQDPDQQPSSTYGLTANRTYFGAVGYIYLIQRPTFLLYSGGRLGISNWSIDSDLGFPSDVIDRVLNFALGSAFAPQLVLIGGETYFIDRVGIYGELAIGSPHFFSFGLSYRL